jgi:hypothetical protein
MAPIIIPIAMAAGSAASGAASGQLQAQQLAQTYALTKRGEALQEGLNANALERQTQTNPLRDQTLYNLAGMLGASPAAFNPTSMLSGTNSGPQGVGGVNQNALANYNAKYTPGAGGVTSNIQQMMLNRLGYGNVPTGTLFDNKTTPADTLTGAPTPGVTSGASNKGGFGVVPDPYSASQNAGYGSPGAPAQSTGAGEGTGNNGAPSRTNPGGSAGMMSAAPFNLASLPSPAAGLMSGGPAPGGALSSSPMSFGTPATAPTNPAAALMTGASPAAPGAASSTVDGDSLQQQQQRALMARLTGGNLGAVGGALGGALAAT